MIGTRMYPLRPPGGGAVVATEAELAAYLAAGYTQAAPSFVAAPDDAGAWDTGPWFLAGHADGRRAAAQYAGYANLLEPVGWYLIGFEGGVTFFALTDDAGNYLVNDAGARLVGY